jgi:tetratricopeptide (TPR) repeat protein
MHAMRGELRGYFESRLLGDDRDRVERHLLSGCRSCRQLACELLAGEVGAADCDAAFWRLMAAMHAGAGVLRAEEARAREQWRYLQKLSVPQRRLRVANDPAYLTYGLFERLAEVARDAVRDDPAAAVGISHLALTLAERLDGAVYVELAARQARLAATALLGNAQRLAADFEGAAASLAEAERLLVEEQAGDPLDRAHVGSLTASLLIDLGRFERAVEALGRARGIYERLEDRHMVGRLDVQQALAIGYADPARGIELLARARHLVDLRREPRLELSIRHTTAFFLCDLGRPREAFELLQRSRWLYHRFGDRAVQVRRLWLEARIHRGLGQLAAATEILAEAAEEMLRHGFRQEHALMAIDLAEIHAACGRHAEAIELVGQIHRSLQSWGMHEEGLAALLLALCSLREQSAQAGLFRELALYLRRAWHRPSTGN